MVGIFAGTGLGLERGSTWLLGSRGQIGDASFGRYGEKVFVNASTGNLVINRTDEVLIGQGPDDAIERTYNSLGQHTDENADNWQLSAARRVGTVTGGNVNHNGTSVSFIDADGSDYTYTYNSTAGCYVCSDRPHRFDTLSYSTVTGQWTGTKLATGLTDTFNSSGQLIACTDADGNQLTYSYTGGLLTTVQTTDTSGYQEKTDLAYTGNNLTQVTTTYWNTTTSTYRTLSRVSYTYTSANRIRTVTTDLTPDIAIDASSVVTTYSYDNVSGQVSQISQTGGAKMQFTYVLVGSDYRVATATQTTASGVTSAYSFSYDTANKTTAVTDQDGQVTTMVYNGDGLLRELDLPTSQVFKWTYTAQNDVATYKDGNGNITNYYYDSTNGNLLTQRDELGNVVTYVYDANNRKVAETHYTVPDPGDETSITPSGAQTTRFAYDSEGHLRFVVSAKGEVQEFQYYGSGSANGDGNVRYSFNYRDALYSVSGLSPSTVLTESQLSTWVSGLTDLSNTERTNYSYDFRGALTQTKAYSVCNADGSGSNSDLFTLVNYTYDQAGNLLTRQTTGVANTEAWIYDGLGRVSTYTDLNAGLSTYAWDDVNNVLVTTRDNGRVETTTYDYAGRPVSVAVSGADATAATSTYVYDSLGRLTKAVDPEGHTHYNIYDAAGRKVADVAGDGSVIEYRYDTNDNLIATVRYATLVTGTPWTNLQNANGDVSVASIRPAPSSGNDVWSWRIYDDSNRVIQTIDGDGSVVDYAYDGMSNLIQTKAYATNLSSITLDGLRATPPLGVQTVTPDAANDRVTRNFFDEDGRQIAVLDGLGYLTQTVYNATGEKIEVIASANQVTNPTTRATGDLSALRTAVGTSNYDQHTHYVYDGRGLLRFTLDVTQRPTEYVYNGAEQLISTIDYAGAISAPTTYSVAQIKLQITNSGLATNSANRTSWQVFDDAGRLAFSIDPVGAVVEYLYDTMGNVKKQVSFSTTRTTTSSPTLSTMNSWATSHNGDTDNRVTRFFYDKKDRLVFEADSKGYVVKHLYYKDDNESGRILYADAYAITDSMTTDDVKTLIGATIPPTARQLAYAYDADDRLSDEYDGNGVRTHYNYNPQGLLASKTLGYGTSLTYTTAYTYDAAGNLVDTVTPLGNRTRLTYNAFGQIDTKVDAKGAGAAFETTTKYDYDQDGRLKTETLAYGVSAEASATGYAYNAFNVTDVTEASNVSGISIVTHSDYDVYGRLTDSTHASGKSDKSITHYTYTAFSEVLERTDAYTTAVATTTHYEYYASGLVASQTRASGTSDASKTAYTYNAFGQVGDVTLGADTGAATITRSVYNTLGLLVSLIRAQGKTEASTTTYAYDAFRQKTDETLASTTHYEYDIGGRLKTQTQGYGSGTTLQTHYEYDGLNRVTDKTVGYSTADATTTRYEYDGDSRLIHEKTDFNATTSAYETLTTYGYDALNRLTSRIDADGTTDATTTVYVYDHLSRMTLETVASGSPDVSTTKYDYNQLGELTDKTVAYNTGDASVTHYDYDFAGRVKLETRAVGQAEQTQTQYLYDALDRVTSRTDAYASPHDAATTLYAYDRRGNVLTVTDGANSTTTDTYDVLDEKLTEVTGTSSATSNSTTYFYDGLGELKTVTRMIGTSASTQDSYQYDARGNLILTTTDVGGTAVATYTFYDSLDRVVATVDGEKYATGTSYNGRGDVISTTRYVGRVTGTITAGVLPTIPTDNTEDEVTTFGRDKLGRLISVGDAEGATEYYQLNDLGQRVVVTNKLGGTTTNLYNKRGLLTQETIHITYTNSDGSSSTNVVNNFEYDLRGNRTKMIEASGARTTIYTYDDLDRLKQTIHDAVYIVDQGTLQTSGTMVNPTEALVYDFRGNVIESDDANGNRTFFYYDDANRKTAQVDAAKALTTWTYGAEGNVLSQRTYEGSYTVTDPTAPPPTGTGNYRETTYGYDRLNRLVTTTVANVVTGEFNGTTYNTSTANVTTTNVYKDGTNNVVQQTDGRGNSTFYYFDKLGRKVAQVDGEKYLTTYILDADGNATRETRWATQVSGTVTYTLQPTVTADAVNDRITYFAYDRNGRRLTESRGAVVYNTVLSNGQLGTQTSGLSRITYTYNALGEVTSKQEATLDITNYVYDDAGRQTMVTQKSFTDYTGATVQSVVDQYYNGLNNLTSSIKRGDGTAGNPDRTTTYTYDVGGRLAKMKDAAGFEMTYGYDKAGNVVRTSYARLLSNGSTVTEAQAMQYDGLNRVTQQTVATLSGSTWTMNGDKTETQYNAYGEVSARGVNGLQENFYYDNAGQLWKSVDGDGTYKIYLYDACGNKTLEISSDGAALDWANLQRDGTNGAIDLLTNHGASGVHIGQYDATGMVVTMNVFDKRGQVVQVREPRRHLDGTATLTTITHGRSYNAFGEVLEEVDGRGNATDYTYSTLGKMLTRQDPLVNDTNAQGGIVSERPLTSYTYDKSGRLIGVTDANGHTSTRTLLANTGYGDDEEKLLKEWHADGALYQRSYDVFGDLRKEINEVAKTETFAYDAMDRLVTQTQSGGLLTDTYAYDGLGQRIQHWNSKLTSTFKDLIDYDAQGRVKSMVDMGGNTTTYTYTWDPTLQTTGLGTFGGWVKVTAGPAYINATTKRSSTEKLDYFGHETYKSDLGGNVFTYTYDANGNLKTEVNGSATTTYAYYNGGLSKSVTQGSNVATYTYDANGNRLTENYTVGGVSLESSVVTYDTLNRMISLDDAGSYYNGGTGYANDSGVPISIDWEYDAVGNIRHMLTTYETLDKEGAVSGSGTQDYWYLYDNMNRFTIDKGNFYGTRGTGTIGIVQPGQLAGDTPSAAMQITYYADGQRQSVTTVTKEHNGVDNYDYNLYHSETYDYASDGYLSTVHISTDSNGNGVAGDIDYVAATYTRDEMGRVTHYVEYKPNSTSKSYDRTATYNEKSQVTTDTVWTYRSDDEYKTVSNYNYNDASGYYQGGALMSVVAYNYHDWDSDWIGESDTTNTYVWRDNAESNTTVYVPKKSDGDTFTSTYTYDSFGNLQQVHIADGRPRDVKFLTDVNGQVVQRDEKDGTTTNGDPRELHYYFNGIQVGDVGNNGTSNIDYAASIATRQSSPTGPFRNGHNVNYADFDQSYDPINGLNYQSTSSRYTVNAGDTLQSIAQELWGDSNFWHLIADANGLTGSETLTAGVDLIVPNKVHNSHNNDDTFRPYDPNDAIGNTSPTTPKKKHTPCGVFGQILQAIITVVVTVVTGSPDAGNIAGQLFGLAVGNQKSFNWKSLAMTDLTAGLDSLGLFSSLGVVGQAMANNALAQGIGVATGLQKSFSWTDVAVAGVTAGVTRAVGDHLGVKWDQKPVSLADRAYRGLSGMAGAFAGAAARTLINGSDFGDNILATLPTATAEAVAGMAKGDYKAPLEGLSLTGLLGAPILNYIENHILSHSSTLDKPTAGEGGGQIQPVEITPAVTLGSTPGLTPDQISHLTDTIGPDAMKSPDYQGIIKDWASKNGLQYQSPIDLVPDPSAPDDGFRHYAVSTQPASVEFDGTLKDLHAVDDHTYGKTVTHVTVTVDEGVSMALVYGPPTNKDEVTGHAYWVALGNESGNIAVANSMTNWNGYAQVTTALDMGVMINWGATDLANSTVRWMSADAEGGRDAANHDVYAATHPKEALQAAGHFFGQYLTWDGPVRAIEDIYNAGVNKAKGAYNAYENGSLPEYLGHNTGAMGYHTMTGVIFSGATSVATSTLGLTARAVLPSVRAAAPLLDSIVPVVEDTAVDMQAVEGEAEVATAAAPGARVVLQGGVRATQIAGRLSPTQMAALQAKHGTEFAQVYMAGPGEGGRGGAYYLIQGTDRGVRIPLGRGVRFINHSHPEMLDGSVVPLTASDSDRRVLRLLQQSGSPQRRSMVVPEVGEPFYYTKDSYRVR